MAGEGEQKHRCASRKRGPQRLQGRPGLVRLFVGEDLRVGVPAVPGKRCARKRKQHEARGPDRGLPAQREQGLDRQGIGNQRQHRAEVGEREEAIGRGAGMRARVPGLHQGACGGEHEVGQADARREQTEDPPRGVAAARGLPDGARGERQRRGRRNKEREVDEAPRAEAQPDVSVRIHVAREQQYLEKQHADRPHGGGAAEPRQDDLGDERLHLEQQESAQKNRGCVQDHGVEV